MLLFYTLSFPTVGTAALVFGLVVIAAGGAWAFHSLKSELSRLAGRVSAMERPTDIYSLDYAQPPSPDPAVIANSGLDVVGAWAAEQEAAGVYVSEEEIASQRAMWAREGV